MTPIERRAGQPVPETEHQAAERFRCEGLLATISGRQCALMHAQARKTGDQFHRHVCVDCPAGMARAALMSIGEPLCSALVNGKPCGRETAPRSRFCQKHKCAGAHMHQRLNERPVFAEGGDIPKAPRRERPQPIQPRACPSCQYVHTPRASIPAEVADWCVGCRCRAKAALQRRHRPTDAEHVARVLGDPEFYEKVMAEDVVEKRKPGRRERGADRRATGHEKARRAYGRVTCRRCEREFVAGHGQKPTPGLEAWCKICRRSATNYVDSYYVGADRTAAILTWLTESDEERRARERAAPRARCISCDYPLLSRRGKSAGVLCFRCAKPVIRYLERHGIKPTPETIEARMRERMSAPDWQPPAFALRRAAAAKMEAAS